MINYKLQVKAGGTRPEVLDFSLGNITKPKVFFDAKRWDGH